MRAEEGAEKTRVVLKARLQPCRKLRICKYGFSRTGTLLGLGHGFSTPSEVGVPREGTLLDGMGREPTGCPIRHASSRVA